MIDNIECKIELPNDLVREDSICDVFKPDSIPVCF